MQHKDRPFSEVQGQCLNVISIYHGSSGSNNDYSVATSEASYQLCVNQACAQMRPGAFKCKCKCKRRIKCKCKCKCSASESNANANANAQQLNQMQMQMHLNQMQMHLNQMRINLYQMQTVFYKCVFCVQQVLIC